jgi:hypothetical protein
LFWAGYGQETSWARQQQGGQQDKREFSIRRKYSNLCICFMYLRNMYCYMVVRKIIMISSTNFIYVGYWLYGGYKVLKC